MSKKHNYIDNVVIQLKRKYTKDELVQVLIKNQKETEFKLGEMTSERDELKHNLERILKVPNDVKSRLGQLRYIRNLKNEIISLREKSRKLKANNQKLLHENIMLKNNI